MRRIFEFGSTKNKVEKEKNSLKDIQILNPEQIIGYRDQNGLINNQMNSSENLPIE
jgi:hypothetical protein